MKKLFALLAVVLAVVSCQRDADDLNVAMGGEQEVMLTVSLPEATRADSAQGGLGEDNDLLSTHSLRYILEIHYNGQVLREAQTTKSASAVFPVRLAPDKTYTFVAWAYFVNKDNENPFYSINETEGLSNIVFTNWANNANSELRDAYTCTQSVLFNSTANLSMTLHRPFAKIRVISTDIADVRKFDLNPTSVEVTYHKPMYTSFNAVTGANGGEYTNFKHVVSLDENHTYADFITTEATLFADYILVDPDGTVQFTMNVWAGNTLIKSTPFNTPIPVVANKLTTIKGDVLTTGGNVSVKVESGLEEFKTITIVDTAESLQEVIKNIEEGGSANIELGGDIDLSAIAGILSTRAGENAGLVIPADRTVVLDLKGFTISQTKTQTGKYALIENNGTLTICNSATKNGTISYGDNAKLTADVGYVSNTIQNNGNLTINEGVTLLNTSGTEVASYGYPHVIDTNGTLTINGGILTNEADYSTMRIWTSNTDAEKCVVVINGGTFNGCIDFQAHNNNYATTPHYGTLTVNGGTFNADTFTKSAIRVLRFGTNAEDMHATINGGDFYGKVWVRNIGTFDSTPAIFTIKGGSFSTLSSIVYLAENCTYTLNSNVDDAETVVFNGKGTLDLNGKTVTTAFAEGSETNHQYAFDNKGELTIKDSVGKGEIFARGNFNYGKMTLESGTIYAFDCNGGYGIRNYEGAEFVMNGGAIIANNEEDHQVDKGGYDATTLRVEEGATATINGGIINNISDYTFAIDNYGTTTINGGTISSIHTTVTNYGAMTINDGSFTCNGIEGKTQHVLWAAEGTTTINGGTFDGKDNYNGFNVDASEGATVYINGGKFLPVHSGSLYGEGTIEVTDGEFFDDPSARVAEGYKAVKGENGYWTIANDPAAQIGATKYDSLQEAFNVGGDITLLRNVTIAETVTLAEGKTAVLDLNGKKIVSGFQANSTTKHIYPFDVYGSLTIKDSSNGGSIEGRGIFVQIGSKLTVEGGAIYGIDSNGGSAIFQYGGDVTINGGLIEQKAEGTYNFAVNGLGGTVTVNGGKIAGNHGAIATAAAEVILNDGEFVCTGTSGMTDNVLYSYETGSIIINGGTFTADNDGPAGGCCVYDENGGVTINGGVFGNSSGGDVWGTTGTTIKGGTFENLIEKQHIAEGYKAIQNEDGSWSVVDSTVAMIGETKYATLNDAVAAVKDGDTITLVANEVFTEKNYIDNGGWKDGLGYAGDKSFTIDLNNNTVSQNGYLNDYLLWFKNVGSKANTITIKNGTLDAGTTAFCALCTASSHENELTINLENITLINKIYNGSTIKVRAGSTLNVNAGTKIIGKDSYLGIENWNATVNVYDGAEIYMNGTSSYNGCLVGVGGNGVVNVYGGYGKGVKGGFIAMTSGGTINVTGGEWIANTDGTIGDNSNLYVLTAQNNKYEGGYAGASIINVTGGTFRGGMDAWILNDVTVEKAELNISGGNFNANPTTYLEEGYTATENNGIYTVSANN